MRHGRLERTEVIFQDDRHLLQVIDRIVSAVGRRIDDSSPIVDARLSDGSRMCDRSDEKVAARRSLSTTRNLGASSGGTGACRRRCPGWQSS